MSTRIGAVLAFLWMAGCAGASAAGAGRSSLESTSAQTRSGSEEVDEEYECEAEAVTGSHIKHRACRSEKAKSEERRATQETMDRWHQTGSQNWRIEGAGAK